MTSDGSIHHPVIFCIVQLMLLGIFCIYTVPIPVLQIINFLYSTVIDDVNVLKINVNLSISLQLILKKNLHKLQLCTLTILTLTTYTCNHMAIMF